MKKLDSYILKSFIGPFFAILLVVVFILMMQFLWLYIDELVGKGLSIKVILEFLGWGCATLLPLSLPLATLLSSMMTLGTLGENNELLAIKAAGISLKRVLTPLMIASFVVSIGTFFATNNLVPVAYNKIYTLRDDIGRTKEEIKIPTGTFYDGIDGYTLRVNSRNEDTGMMHDVMVYNHNGTKGNTSLTLADSALMKMSEDKTYLTFILYDGINYEETNTRKYRDTTLQLQKIEFHRQELVIPLENYAFKKSEDTRFDDQVTAMNLKQLNHGEDSIGRLNSDIRKDHLETLRKSTILMYNSQLDTSRHEAITVPFTYEGFMEWDDIGGEIRSRFLTIPGGEAMPAARGWAEKEISDVMGRRSNSPSRVLGLSSEAESNRAALAEARRDVDAYGDLASRRGSLEEELEGLREASSASMEDKRVHDLYEAQRANYDALSHLGASLAGLGTFREVTDADRAELARLQGGLSQGSDCHGPQRRGLPRSSNRPRQVHILRALPEGVSLQRRCRPGPKERARVCLRIQERRRGQGAQLLWRSFLGTRQAGHRRRRGRVRRGLRRRVRRAPHSLRGRSLP